MIIAQESWYPRRFIAGEDASERSMNRAATVNPEALDTLRVPFPCLRGTRDTPPGI